MGFEQDSSVQPAALDIRHQCFGKGAQVVGGGQQPGVLLHQPFVQQVADAGDQVHHFVVGVFGGDAGQDAEHVHRRVAGLVESFQASSQERWVGETAIKAARRWGYRVKGIARDKARIVTATDNFHGRTTTIVGFSTEPQYKDGFGPFSDGFDTATFGDIDSFRAAIGPNTCAVLIEPIQGEAGIRVPPQGFLRQLRELCDATHTLLILDEIQSGLGRTGKTFAFEHEGIRPDGLIVGKALGGGILPVSAFIADHALMDLFDAGSHGSTFGGNPLAAAVGLEALRVLQDEQLAQNSAELGAYLQQRLREMAVPFVRDIRGRGLWVGIELDRPARPYCEALMALGVLAKETHETVLRIAPPLCISRDELDWGLERIAQVLVDC
ncbi:aminotransferase class III-fold pyridoxal phosphate-dependent enzyme [Pseudomonas sp. RW3S2]|nr:aminotransferase class III-fold pyridoxal phosphate-dependent enzyme [Pseudomonas sp. RW3S2]